MRFDRSFLAALGFCLAALGFCLFAALAPGLGAGPAAAQDHSRLYSDAEISADAERLQTAMTKIYELGLAPALTDAERAALQGMQLEFPRPRGGERTLDFFAVQEGRFSSIVLPLLSLKTLEDLTTAYAWLVSEGWSPGTIDLYFAVLREEAPPAFPGGAYLPPLAALGAPADAWKHPPVDDLSLRLRNEAFAFVLAHEIGHIVLGHAADLPASNEQSQRDEAAADAFALELLGRTGTPSLGAALLFQAQAYALPHPGQFDTEAEWYAFLDEKSAHPVTTARIRALADYMRGPLIASRPTERAVWTEIGQQVSRVADILDDDELQRCVVLAARSARAEDLKPRRDPAEALFAAACL